MVDGFWPSNGNPFTFFGDGIYQCKGFSNKNVPLPSFMTERLINVEFNFCYGPGIGKLFSIKLSSDTSPFSVEGGIKWANADFPMYPAGYLKFCYKFKYYPFNKKGGANVDVPGSGATSINFEVEIGPCFTIMVRRQSYGVDLTLELTGEATLTAGSQAVSGIAGLTGSWTFADWRFNDGNPKYYKGMTFSARYDAKIYIMNKNFCSMRGLIADDGDWDYVTEKIGEGYDAATKALSDLKSNIAGSVLGTSPPRRRRTSSPPRRRSSWWRWWR
jgi:hypothetical protein